MTATLFKAKSCLHPPAELPQPECCLAVPDSHSGTIPGIQVFSLICCRLPIVYIAAAGPNHDYDNYDYHYSHDHPRLGRGVGARPRPSPRHVRVESGPVGGHTRLIKDIAREHSAPDPVKTRVYLRVGASQAGPLAQRARLPGPRRLRRRLARRARQRAARVQGRGLGVHPGNTRAPPRRGAFPREERPFPVSQDASYGAWRRKAERMACHWPTL
jgi:hypothetical protein